MTQTAVALKMKDQWRSVGGGGVAFWKCPGPAEAGPGGPQKRKDAAVDPALDVYIAA